MVREPLWSQSWLSEVEVALERALSIYFPLHRLGNWGTGRSRVHCQLVGTFWLSGYGKTVAPHCKQGLPSFYFRSLWYCLFSLMDENEVSFTFRHIWKRELGLARSLQDVSIQAGLSPSVPGGHCFLLCWLASGPVRGRSNFCLSLFWKKATGQRQKRGMENLCGGRLKEIGWFYYSFFFLFGLACIFIDSCTTTLQFDVGIQGAVIMVTTVPLSPERFISIG